MSWKDFVLGHHQDAVCLWAKLSGAWVVYIDGFAVGVNNRRAAGAWKMAADFVISRRKLP